MSFRGRRFKPRVTACWAAGKVRGLIAAIIFVFAVATTPAPAAGESKPNFLLLCADDLTYTDLGAFGNQEVRTPHLDKLASQGMRFHYFFNSAPMCAPTRMALYTGIHPVRNGAHPNHSFVYPHIRSMPHYLEPLGYDVALIGKRHYQPRENFPFEHLGGREHDSGEDGPDLHVGDALDYLEARKDRPWAMVVANNQPHRPWNRGDASLYEPAELTLPPYLVDTPETREALARYYMEITYMDALFGRLLDGLERIGLDDNTFVTFVSEQGSNFPHCKWTCYDTGLRSSVIVRWPGHVEPGSETDAMVQYVDILPTFIELAGGNPLEFDFDGKSFSGVLRGETLEHNDYVYGVQTSRGIYSGPEAYGIRAVRDRRYRLIWNLNYESEFQNTVTEGFAPYLSWVRKGEAGDAFAREQANRYRKRPEYELYDLQNDPFEMRNLAGDPGLSGIERRLRARLVAWMEQQGDQGKATEAAAKQRQRQSREGRQ